eukprot:PITA_05026
MDFHRLPQNLPPPLSATWRATVGYGALIFFLLYWILRHKGGRNGRRLPPGPHPWPIIGNLHQMKKPVHHALKDLADKYGPIMFLRLGSVPTVVVSSSEIAKHFLKTQDSIFASRPATAAGKYLSYNFKGMILSPYGDYWRQVRKLCVLELFTSKRIESFKHAREEEVSAMTQSIWEQSQSGTIAVNVSKAMLTLSSNVISRILFRRKVSDDDMGADGKGFKHLLLELSATVGDLNIGDFIPYLDWMDLQGIKRRMVEISKTYDAFAEKIIDEHLNVQAAAPSSDGQAEAEAEAEHVKDFVDVLLQMTADNNHIKGDTKARRETVKSIMFDILIAGMETSASTLEWTMSELFRHPHVLKKLQEEIESTVGKRGKVNGSDVRRMKCLQCVVKETLRLHPPVPLALPHESVETATVCGYNIPTKTTVMVNVWAIGRDPNVWGVDALDFKPERFMHELGEHDNIMDLVTGQSDFRMLPFSAGRRGCPGATMAIPMIELALAQLLHSFDWRVDGDPSELDMTEEGGSSISRQVPLFAFPKVRREGL